MNDMYEKKERNRKKKINYQIYHHLKPKDIYDNNSLNSL